MRIAFSRLGNDDSDKDDIVARRNMIARGKSRERTNYENKSNDNAYDEQLKANAKSDSSEDRTQQTSNIVRGKWKRVDDAIVFLMHVEASNNAGAEEPSMDCDSLEQKNLRQPPPSNIGSFKMLPTH